MTQITRRAFNAGIVVAPFALGACASGPITPASVAQDIALIDNGVGNVLKQLAISVPTSVVTAMSDLSTVAEAVSGAETTTAAQPLVQRVATDVLAVAKAVLPLVPGGSLVAMAIEAAQVLVPAIEAAVGLAVTASATPSGMTVAQARLILGMAAK